MYAEEDYQMLSGLQHFAYCRRQWALIHIEQQWAENERTVDGHLFHRKAHDGEATEKRGDLIITRGLPVKSDTLGVSGICDVVEFHRSKQGITLFSFEGRWRERPTNFSSAPRQCVWKRCCCAIFPKEACSTDRIEEGQRWSLPVNCVGL